MNLDGDCKVLVQGIANPLGSDRARAMSAYGTNVVAGVSPGYGDTDIEGLPVFDSIDRAVAATGTIDTSVICTHPYQALDAAIEAIAAGIRQIIILSEGVPPLDMVRLLRKAEVTDTFVVGPSCPGIIVPGKMLLGTHPTEFYKPGPVGIVSRGGTLTYEVALSLTRAGLGQSICVGIGGDPIVGSSFDGWLQIFDEDDRTEAMVLVGEIGGSSEEAAAEYVADAIDKPVIAYVAGRYAPRGRRLCHAGAIVAARSLDTSAGTYPTRQEEVGTADSKIEAFDRVGIPVADRPSAIPVLVSAAMEKRKSPSAK